MRKLVINTKFPAVVQTLLLRHHLIERNSTWQKERELEIAYPNDALSQELVFWFVMAVGCGLVNDYHLDKTQDR